MVHQYRNNGYNIVLDVNSGAIHVVDDVTYDIIGLYRQLDDGRKAALGRAGTGTSCLACDSLERRAKGGGAGMAADGLRSGLLDGCGKDAPAGDMHARCVKESPADGLRSCLACDDLEQRAEGGVAGMAADSLRGGLSEKEVLDRLSPKYGRDEVLEALGEVHALMDRGELFTEDVYEDYMEDFKDRPTVVKALCLHIAHGCNLACRYCFAGKGEYHGERALMPFDVGKEALDFLIANSGQRRNLEVDFFGGEPLLNWQVVKDLVAYGREQEKAHGKKFRFTLTTNGVLLDQEVMEFCNREMANVVLSIDGRREVHDKMRPFRGGGGSYGLILPKLLEFAESRGGERYYVRGTYTHDNLDFSRDVLHLADLGFTQISVEPVVSPPSEPYAIQEGDLPQLFREYDSLAAEMVRRHREGKDFNFFHFMIDLEGGPCVAKRLSGCGSGTEYLAVTPWGDLYPCHQFVGNEKFLLGNVKDGIRNKALCEKFKGCNVYAKEKCRGCFAKFYCSGGCAANAYHFTGDICGTYDIGCELQKKRVECAIMIKAAEQE